MDSIATYAVLASALFAAVYFYVASAGKRSPKIKVPAVLKAAAAATAAIAPGSTPIVKHMSKKDRKEAAALGMESFRAIADLRNHLPLFTSSSSDTTPVRPILKFPSNSLCVGPAGVIMALQELFDLTEEIGETFTPFISFLSCGG